MVARRGEVPLGGFSDLSSQEEAMESGKPKIVLKEFKTDERRAPLRQPGRLLGSILWEGDIVSPVDETWDAES
jgi:hypothetical protein